MTDLLPCPFCGGEAHISVSSDGYGIECANDRCLDMILDQLPSEAEAIAAWNTRAERTCRNTDTDDDAYFKCSECGAECSVEWCHAGWGVPSFCPNCGSKVVKE